MIFNQVNNYKLYVGLNDKDSYVQIIASEEAENRSRIIVGELVGGATFSNKQGYWVDELGNPTMENTIEITISNCNDEVIEEVCRKLNAEFNQNCIMVEKTVVQVAFCGER